MSSSSSKKRRPKAKKKNGSSSSSSSSSGKDVPVEIVQMSGLLKTFQKCVADLNVATSDNVVATTSAAGIVRYFRQELAKDPVDQHKHMIIQERLDPLVCLALSRTFQLQSYDRLRSFRVLNADVRDAGVAQLATGLRYLSRVNRIDFTQCLMGAVGAAALGAELGRSGAHHIVHVHCDHNSLMGDEGLERLILGGLCRHRSLQTLNVSYCGLRPRAGAILGKLLVACRSLKTLNVQGNALGNQGIADLATQGVLHHPSLQCINLSQTSFGDDTPTIVALMTAAESAPSLHTLHIDGNLICDDGMQVVLAALERQCTTTTTTTTTTITTTATGGSGAHLFNMKIPLTASSTMFAAITAKLRQLVPKKKRRGKKKKTKKGAAAEGMK